MPPNNLGWQLHAGAETGCEANQVDAGQHELNSGGQWKGIQFEAQCQCFYTKEKVDSKVVDIADCPTEDMVADFLTKPLQGNLFQKLCDQIMGLV